METFPQEPEDFADDEDLEDDDFASLEDDDGHGAEDDLDDLVVDDGLADE